MKKYDVKEKLRTAFLIAGTAFMNMTVNIYAGGLQSTKLYTGGVKLINDGTTAVLALLALGVGLKEALLFVKWLNAEENEQSAIVKSMKTTVGIGILGETIVGVIKIVLAYFK